MEDFKEIPEFKETADLDLAGYFLVKDFQLDSVKIRGHYVIFKFKNSEALEKEYIKYFNQEAFVDAYTLCQAIRRLRLQTRELRVHTGGEK